MDRGGLEKRKRREGLGLAKEKACRNCRFISMGNICPNCKSSNLSDDWSGLIVIINPEKSEIGKKIDAKSPGKYAIRVR